ncbi:MAG: YegP family protein [Flammeovirgaceae bacterium]
MKFELFQSEKNQQYYFRLKAGNGQIILQSEGYTTKTAAKNGIESVKKNAGLDERYERKEAVNGKFYFVLKAANHQVIGQSQLYSSKDSMENGIESVKKNAVNAEIVEIDKEE